MGCGVVTGLSGGEGAGFGLAKGDRFGHPFVLGLASDVVGCNLLALMVEAGVGVQSTKGMGLGPIDSSTSVAQSNRACSCSTGVTAALAVGDGVGSHTSPWVIPVPPCSPVSDFFCCSVFCLLAPSSFSTPFSSSFLLTP